jgi:hypothetical protein
MNRVLLVLATLACANTALAAEPAPIEVMVLGTYHFDRFRPTKVAIEKVPTTPDLADPAYV